MTGIGDSGGVWKDCSEEPGEEEEEEEEEPPPWPKGWYSIVGDIFIIVV